MGARLLGHLVYSETPMNWLSYFSPGKVLKVWS